MSPNHVGALKEETELRSIATLQYVRVRQWVMAINRMVNELNRLGVKLFL